MAAKQVVPPAGLPVSLVEAKAHLRVDGVDEDVLISGLIAAAVDHIEQYTQRAILSQQWLLQLSAFFPVIELPRPPFVRLVQCNYVDANGDDQQLWPTDMVVDDSGLFGLLLPKGSGWPQTMKHPAAVRLLFECGAPDASRVPASIKQAILLLVGYWFEQREAVVTGTIATALPFAVEALLAPYRVLTIR